MNMPAGKSTDHTLAHRLDALVPAAGSAFNKDAAWEKLQQQLDHKKNNGRLHLTWLWAAAILMVLFSLYWLIPANHQQANGFTSIKKINPAISVLNAESSKGAAITNKPGIQQASSEQNKSLVFPAYTTVVTDTVQSTVQVPVNNPVTETSIKDTATAISMQPVPAAIKKKLPLVYNNEIVRSDIPETTPAGGSGTTITIPGLKKDNRETLHKAESNEVNPVDSKNRWLPFNRSAKPKE